MHETSQNKLVQLIPKLGIEYYYDDGTPLYYTRDGRAGSQFKAKKVADEFADYSMFAYIFFDPESEIEVLPALSLRQTFWLSFGLDSCFHEILH
jgi:hypothetical protein